MEVSSKDYLQFSIITRKNAYENRLYPRNQYCAPFMCTHCTVLSYIIIMDGPDIRQPDIQSRLDTEYPTEAGHWIWDIRQDTKFDVRSADIQSASKSGREPDTGYINGGISGTFLNHSYFRLGELHQTEVGQLHGRIQSQLQGMRSRKEILHSPPLKKNKKKIGHGFLFNEFTSYFVKFMEN